MKSGFIWPTGVFVDGLLNNGFYLDKQWLFNFGETRFVLGESCSGTTFYSLLVAYIAYRIRTHRISVAWLLLAYPVAIVANAIRVSSSIYIYEILQLFDNHAFSDALHVLVGSVTFLSVFLIFAFAIDKPLRRTLHEA